MNKMYTESLLAAMLAVTSKDHARGGSLSSGSQSASPGPVQLFDGAPAGLANVGKNKNTQTFKFFFDTGRERRSFKSYQTS